MQFAPSVRARIQPLESGASAFDATLMEVLGRGMRFLSARAVRPDSALKIEIGDALLLAEVIHCAPAPPSSGGSFVLAVNVDQILSSLADLLRLQHALLEDTYGADCHSR